ncbi:MAG: hypothetical protein SOV57_07065 [Bacilli bacterium]|nr:hypothetical protein [Bacilli bacterium]MDY3889981.1 hypothetical protein [Bacilli bacterium]
MNYDVKMKNMILELLKFKQYKRMHLAFKILVAILELPFILLLLLSVGSFYLTYAIFRSISEPIDYINNLIKEEGKEVKHASQFIIYFFGFPVVLIGTIFTSSLTFFIFFEFLLSSIYGEVVSLHGFKFQPFISKADDDFSLSISEEKFQLWRPLTFVIIGGIFSIILILCCVYWGEFDYQYEVLSLLYFIYILFFFLYSLLGFNQKQSGNISLKKEEVVDNQD